MYYKKVCQVCEAVLAENIDVTNPEATRVTYTICNDCYEPGGSFLKFIPFKKLANTWVYDVINRKNGCVVGKIKWAGNFRKYAYFPEHNIMLDSKCMKTIECFLNKLMKERTNADK